MRGHERTPYAGADIDVKVRDAHAESSAASRQRRIVEVSGPS